MILALLLATAGLSNRVAVMDQTVRVPPAEWRVFDLALRQRAAVLECSYSLVSGGSGVRVFLIPGHDVAPLRAGKGHRVLISTDFEQSGRFRYGVAPGEYALVVDNRLDGRGPADVRLQLSAVFPNPLPRARVLPAKRRAIVIAVSLLFFAAIALFAGRKLKRGLASRPGALLPPSLSAD